MDEPLARVQKQLCQPEECYGHQTNRRVDTISELGEGSNSGDAKYAKGTP